MPNQKPHRRLSFAAHDFTIRMSRAELAHTRLEHLVSYVDPAVAALALGPRWAQGCVSGGTEWHGRADNIPVTLAWDWILTHDAAVTLSLDVYPRTNIEITDSHGRPLSVRAALLALQGKIEGLEWRERVKEALAPGVLAAENESPIS